MKFTSAVSALLLGAFSAHGQSTYYWHRDSALTGAGGIGRSYNWALNKNGSGARPISLADDQFEAGSLDTAWKFLAADGDTTGAYAFKDGKLILSGRGADFTQSQHFLTGVHRKDIRGIFDVTVRVDSQVTAHDWSKAGILVSNDWQDFTKGGTALIALTPKQGVIFETSTGTPGNIDKTYWPNPVPGWPVWLRLVKSATAVTAWYRTDSTAAWTQVGGPETPVGLSTDSDVGLFVVAVDSAGKTVKTTAGVFDDFRGGADIAPTTLDLRFDGTGVGHDVDINFASNFSAHSVDFGTYPGKLSFSSYSLILSGGAKFSPAMSISHGTGSLIFTGATGPDDLFLKPNDTLPAIRKTGAGRLVLKNAQLYAPSLRIENGIFDFGGYGADVGGLATTGGSMEGLEGNASLIVTGEADFSGLNSSAASVGNVVIKAFGSGSTLFTPGGKTFTRLTLWTWPVTAKTTLTVGPGSFSTSENLVLRNHLNASGFDGVIDFRTQSPSVTIGGDISQITDGNPGNNHQTLWLGNGAWTAQGNMNVSLEAGGSADTSVFHFGKNAGTQTLTVANGALYAVEHDGAGTVKLTAALSATRLSQTAGSFDFGGFDLTLKGDLKVEKGGPQTLLNLGGRTVSVDGNASFAGKSSGDTGVGLGLDPATAWKLKVKGSLTADSTDVGNCDASGFTKGVASKESHDMGKNLNWSFWTSPLAASVTRDPVDVIAKPGWKVAFTTGAQGFPVPTYDWYRQGDSVAISHDTTLTLDSVKIAQDGSAYYCVVANALGKDTTRQAILTVRACDSSFAPPADQSVAEGAMVTLAGKAGCASEVAWNPVSGPVPRILDPQVDTLRFIAPRVKGDSILVLQYSARFGANWETQNVAVKVKDTIPDPAAALDSQPTWNGQAARVIHARVANAKDLARFPTYPLRYLWAVNPLFADTVAAGDSLVFQNPTDNGNVDVSLCVDNGGFPACVKTVLQIQRVSLALLRGRLHAGPVWLSGGRLAWNRPGLVRIMDWRGRVLWERWGSQGSSEEPPSGAAHSLRSGAARMDFLEQKPGR